MNHLAFISYRRDDSQEASQGLYAQLRIRFGPSRFFMDVNTISPGSQWPERITNSLQAATVMIVVIGQKWLITADKYGRRRLDQKDDWVRREIATGITKGIPLIPVLISNASLPDIEGLPNNLKPILTYQGIPLRNDTWDSDLNMLAQRLIDYGFIENEQRIILPTPKVKIPPLSDEQLSDALATLDGWEPVESLVPGEYPKTRQELRKVYRFKTFPKAIEYMQEASKQIVKIQHHPRWQNQWRTVTVWLCTWDIGNKISAIDVELARELDNIYTKYSS